MYYSKFDCELNHIDYFWCDGKSWIRRNCKYSIEGLKENIFKSLAQVKGSTILGHYQNCLRQIDWYKKKIQYGTGEQKKLISH